MNVIVFSNIVLILRLGFLYYFARELYLTAFKRKKDKFIWFFVVLIFGLVGYSYYVAFKRNLVRKRKFAPQFNNHNLQG